MSSYADTQQPLGLGSIVGDAFSIFFHRFGLMFVLSIIPALIVFVVALLVPVKAAPQTPGDLMALAEPFLVVWITQLFASSLCNSLIVLAAFDTKIGRPGRLGVYIKWALANLVTVILMSLAVFIVMAVPIIVVGGLIFAIAASGGPPGILFFILGVGAVVYMIYFWSAFTPVVPAIVIEGAGFGAMGRAWGLTRGYRWRIVGVMLVLFIVVALIGSVGSLVGGLFAAIGGEWLSALVSLAINAVAGGILAVGLAMIYARLRAIKEGLDVQSLADVFQ
jgi:hypothetical protein